MIGRIRWALALWWIALALSAVALFVNQVLWHGTGIGPGPAMGTAALAVQAVMLVLVARRNSIARALIVLFLVLSTLPLGIIPRLIIERSWWEATYTGLVFLLKAIGVLLLFGGVGFRRTPSE